MGTTYMLNMTPIDMMSSGVKGQKTGFLGEVFLDWIVTLTMNYLPRLLICLNNTFIMITALHHLLPRL